MLVREIASINQTVQTAWARISSEVIRDREEAIRKAIDAYRTDVRVTTLAKALENIGVVNGEQCAWATATGALAFGGASAPKHSATSVYQEVQDTRKKLALGYETPNLGADPAYAALSIALATSTMKWPALQTHVYLLVTDLNVAKTYDDIRSAILTFTTIIR